MKALAKLLILVMLLSTFDAAAVFAEDYGIGQYRGSWGVKPVDGSKKMEPVKASDQSSWPELQQSRGSWLDKLLAALGRWIGADDWGKKDDASTKVKTLDDKQMPRAQDNYKAPKTDSRWEQFMEGGSKFPGASKMQGAQMAPAGK